MRHNNTVVDAGTQTMRCKVCGDEVPIPLGALRWVSAVMMAFAAEHADASGACGHSAGRTMFSTPTEQNGGEK